MRRGPVLFRLDGASALVTGAGHGIGRATALLLAASGASVRVSDIDRMAAETVAEEIRAGGGVASAHCIDVADETSVEATIGAIAAQGGLDVLVNNAGIALRKPTIDLSRADWDKVVSVNMTGVFLCSRVAARDMLQRGRGGAIVNTASIMGLSGGGLYPNISYHATKGAVVNMTRALAIEWAAAGIRVNAVAPTWVKTRLIAALLAEPESLAHMQKVTPLGRLAEPEDVAAAIVFLASPAAAMITGHTLPVDGGFLAQ
jgi:NAD(P)-dependent dehydrogenase (short-subunit alcohol dehydrogenase family)